MSTVTEQWIFGRAKTYELLNQFFTTTTGYSVLRPNKRLVGVRVDTEGSESCDEEVNSQVEKSEEQQMSERQILYEDDNLVSIDIEEFLEDNEVCAFEATVEGGGKIVRKASAAREILNENEYVIADELDSTDDNEVLVEDR